MIWPNCTGPNSASSSHYSARHSAAERTLLRMFKGAVRCFTAHQRITDQPHGGKHMNPVVHFEMPYDNRERMAKFYGTAFGWQTQLLGQEMGNYVVATTTATDDRGPKTPGAINGGFFEKKD